MRLSKRTEYALKALVHLGRLPADKFVQSRDLARAEHLPGKYVELVLMALRRQGILVSRAGVGGGYKLAKSPSQIGIAGVIEALQGSDGAPQSKRGEVRSAGAAALELIHRRLEDVCEKALGDLTLETLLEQIPRQFSAPAAMYYI